MILHEFSGFQPFTTGRRNIGPEQTAGWKKFPDAEPLIPELPWKIVFLTVPLFDAQKNAVFKHTHSLLLKKRDFLSNKV